MGYLPEAMRNYLTRLGWGHGDSEIFSDAEAVSWFDVRDVVKSPARLDWAKLAFVNAHYIKDADNERLADLVRGDIARRGETLPDGVDRRLATLIELLKEGAKSTLDIAASLEFVIKTRPLSLDEKCKGLLTEETRARLSRLAEHLAAVEFQREPLEAAIRAFAGQEGVGVGKFGAALRGVLSGGSPAPDLATALTALGRDEALGRILDGVS